MALTTTSLNADSVVLRSSTADPFSPAVWNCSTKVVTSASLPEAMRARLEVILTDMVTVGAFTLVELQAGAGAGLLQAALQVSDLTSTGASVVAITVSGSIVTMTVTPAASPAVFGLQLPHSIATRGLGVHSSPAARMSPPVTTVTASGYTALATDSTVLVNSAGAFTLNLPAAAASTGRVYRIKNINTGIVTVTPADADTIDGNANITLATRYESVDLICDGSAWYIL